MIQLRPAFEAPLPDLVALENEALAGSHPPFQTDTREFARRLAVDAIDLGASWVASLGGKDVGLALVARRGGFARVVAMGVVPSARKQGIGRSLIDGVLAGGRAAGDVKLIADVDEDNVAALRLARSEGFHSWRRLVGWERNVNNVLTKEPSRTAVELPLRHAAWAAARNAEKDLPWQFAPESIANLTPPYRAFEHDHSAYCVVKLMDDGTLRVRAMVVRTESRRRGLGSAVLNGAVKLLGARRVEIPTWCPEGLWDNFFTHAGFARSQRVRIELRRQIERAVLS